MKTETISIADKKKEMPQIQKSKVDEIFTLVKNKDGVKIAIGNFQVSKKTFKRIENAEKYIAEKPYELIINVAYLAASQTIKEELKNENN